MIPQGHAARLLHGLGLPFRALGTIFAHPALWPLAAAPALLTIFGLVAGFFLGHLGAEHILGAIWTEPAGGLAHFAWSVLSWSMMLTIALSTALVAPILLGAPFNDRLSAAVESRILGTPEPEGGFARFAKEILTSVVNALARLLRFGLVQALIFCVSFIPVVNAAYPVLAFLWSAIWLAEQSLDQTAARHLFHWRATRDALKAARPMGFGMGLMLAGLFLVPLANLLVVPVAVVSGALFYCELQQDGLMPAPEPRVAR